MSESPLKVLITATNGVGHLHACLGVGSILVKRGHDVHFAYHETSKAAIEKNGMKFISLTDHQTPGHEVLTALPTDPRLFEFKVSNALKYSPLEMVKNPAVSQMDNFAFIMLLEMSKAENHAMLNIIDEIKPDICLADYLWVMPWMVKTEVPVVPIMSTAPNNLYNGPPLMSDYSVHDSPELWQEFRELTEKGKVQFVEKRKQLFEHFDAEYVPEIYAKHLGIYVYPEPLDLIELGPPTKNWVRLDSAIRVSESSDFTVPEKLVNLPGKLIYVSMGTLASMVPRMITMIVDPLANVQHRFIISKGTNGDQVKLHDNMWGENYVNQVAILPKVDLFITHGGSNSLIEGLAAGKPLIIVPQFVDQLNNAQRIVDLKLGAKVNLWEFSGEKLIEAINHVLNSQEIQENVQKVAEQLKNSDSSDQVCELIEKLARTRDTILSSPTINYLLNTI